MTTPALKGRALSKEHLSSRAGPEKALTAAAAHHGAAGLTAGPSLQGAPSAPHSPR